MNDQNAELSNDIVTLLATNGWERTKYLIFGDSAVEALAYRFKDPLLTAGFDRVLLLAQWHAI